MNTDRLSEYFRQARKPSLTSSEAISDKGRNRNATFSEKVSSKNRSTPHQKLQIPLFIGLSDGGVLLYHLTRDLTNAPTTLCLLCDVATLGSVASYVATYVLLRAETLFRPYGSLPLSSTLWGGDKRGAFGEAGRGIPLVRSMVRCVVRCWTNTSPSKSRCSKGLSGFLVRCCVSFRQKGLIACSAPAAGFT